jgi:2-polyprenyl-6-methoxyphenol hydroxylase-like FAD-dependent oxidoreductase
MNEQIGDHAVVLGASMAGLLAARVLADAYAAVTVVDRDALPVTSRPRRGVPQDRHGHVLLARGQQALEELFPGITAELVAQGVPAGDLLGQTRWYLGGGRLRQADSGQTFLFASRPFLEGAVRARVRALPNVSFAERCDILGLATTTDRRRVIGARVLRRADGSAGEVLRADLVIDATGRGSRLPVWLDELGYHRPAEERVRIGVGYASRIYRARPGALGGDMAILCAPTPEHPRGGGLAVVEGDRYLLTLIGVLGDYPPTDAEGFLGFAHSLHVPDIYQVIRDAQPLEDPVAFRFPAGVRRRYERLARTPEGLLVIGDAVCSFNPSYGQGMTVAALQALTLRRHLRRGITPQSRRFLRDVARVVDTPWEMAVGGDLAFPKVEGRRTLKFKFVNAYLPRLQAAAVQDASLATAFVRVAGLVDRPEALLRPGVALRVLRRTRRRPPARTAPVDAVAVSDALA